MLFSQSSLAKLYRSTPCPSQHGSTLMPPLPLLYPAGTPRFLRRTRLSWACWIALPPGAYSGLPNDTPGFSRIWLVATIVNRFDAINDVMQWQGAFGYTMECEDTKALRGVRSFTLAEGSVEIMKLIIARELLGKDFLAYK